MNTRIKICGITNVADACAAVEAGADFIGLVFVGNSPRYVDLKQARQIVEAVGNQAQMVGVFQNITEETVNEVAAELKLDFVQFHGQETIAMCNATNVAVIKAFELTPALDWEQVLAYEDAVRYLLFDRPKGCCEGDWLKSAREQMSNRPALTRPFFFAGGLGVDNVADVVDQILPFAVDVSSGVEIEPGLKDHSKMKRFCESIRQSAGNLANSVQSSLSMIHAYSPEAPLCEIQSGQK